MSEFKSERRSLLKSAAIGGVAVSLPISVSAALKPVVDGLERAEFPMPDFNSVKGDSVAIRSVLGDRHQAEVIEVSEMPFACQAHTRPAHLRSCAKVVRFKVADAGLFENEVYQLSHPQLGKMDLLLSVVPNANGELGLEAVFN